MVYLADKKRGYSLVEILIGISLIGVGLLAVTGIFPFGIAHIRVMNQRVFVIQQAQAKLEQLKSMSYDSLFKLSNDNGGFLPVAAGPLVDIHNNPCPGYSYRAHFTRPVFPNLETTKVVQIKFEIYWNESNSFGKSDKDKSYVLYGYKAMETE
jgi:prepilin-type N-terminal cleavage/methylation domain-containing protein